MSMAFWHTLVVMHSILRQYAWSPSNMLEAVIEPKRNAPFGIFCLH